MRLMYVMAVLLAATAGGEALAADSQPNFVFIMADDLGWADVGWHGGNAPTPVLDRLAATSLELTQHYVAPVCSPTRTGLLTGRYWSRFGITTPANERALPWDTLTLARALKTVGYATCLTGKWHLGSKPEWGPNHFGFDHSYGSLAGGVGPWNHLYKQGPYSSTWHRNEQLLDEEGHVTDLVTQEAVRWISERGDEPFFLYVPYTAVHLPVKEPAEWLRRVPPSIAGDVPRHYAACTMHLDDAVGRIIAALERSGHRDNTLLIFTSDNGGSTAENNDTRYENDPYPPGDLPGNNQPLRGKKGDLYEGGIRVPTIVSWPGTVDKGRCNVPLHIADWTPTFCKLAGCSPTADPNWDGVNIWSSLSAGAPRISPLLYWAGPNYRATAIRDGDWKLISFAVEGGKKSELFELSTDPNEENDLANDMPGKVAELEVKLKAIAQSDNASAVRD